MSIEQSSIDKLVGFLTGSLNKADYEYLENFFGMLGEFGFVNEDFPGIPMVYAMVNGYTEKDVPYLYASGMDVPYQWAPRFYSEEERKAYAAKAKNRVIFCSEEEILTRLPKVSKRDTPEMEAMRTRQTNNSVAAVLRTATQLEAAQGTTCEGKPAGDQVEMKTLRGHIPFNALTAYLDADELLKKIPSPEKVSSELGYPSMLTQYANDDAVLRRARHISDALDAAKLTGDHLEMFGLSRDLLNDKPANLQHPTFRWDPTEGDPVFKRFVENGGLAEWISLSKENLQSEVNNANLSPPPRTDNWLKQAVGDVSLFAQAADIDALRTYPWQETTQIGAGLYSDINVVGQALAVSSTMLKAPKLAADSKSLVLMIRELAYRPEFDSMVELIGKVAPVDQPAIDLTGDYRRGVPTALGGGWDPNRGYVPLARPEKYGKLIASFFKINEDFYNSKLDLLRDLVTAPEKCDDGTVWVRVAPENLDWFKTIIDSVPEEVASWEGMVYANGDGGEEIQFRTMVVGPNGPIGFTETPTTSG